MSSRAAAKKMPNKSPKAPAPKAAHKPAPKLVKVAPARKPAAKVVVAPKASAPKVAAHGAPKVAAPKALAPKAIAPPRPPAPPPPRHEERKPMARPLPPPPPMNKAPLSPPMVKRPPAPPVPHGSPPLRAEPPKQSLARSFYWSELRIGDDLPPLSKPPVDRVQVARYAAASGDFNRLHLDEPFTHAVGFPGVFAPGMLAMGFVGQLLSAWLRRGHVRRLSARFVKIVWPGDELTCRGRIADLRKENGGCYADVELWAENQKGELVLRGQAVCELYESPASGGGDGAGFLFGPAHGGGKLAPAQRPAPARPPPGPAKKK